jgi:hypothetical protein
MTNIELRRLVAELGIRVVKALRAENNIVKITKEDE